MNDAAPLPLPQDDAPPEVPSHLAWAVLATLLCCFPTGVVAVVHAYRVDARLRAGDVAGARRASRNALVWAGISAAVAVVAVSVYFALAVSDSFRIGS